MDKFHVEPSSSRRTTMACRCLHIFVALLFSSMLAGSSFVVYLSWFTDKIDEEICRTQIIADGTENYRMWRKSTVSPMFRVHLFNYTNYEAFASGQAERLLVEDVGPFSYEETLERLNVVFSDTEPTLDYQEKRSYRYLPEYSGGRREFEKIIVPNIPLMTAYAINLNSNYLMRVSVSNLLRPMTKGLFLELPVHNFLFGYHDSLYAVAKGLMSLQSPSQLNERFGLLAQRVGLSTDIFTIGTGEFDLNDIGAIKRINYVQELSHWGTAECNRIGGTDGSRFSPYTVRDKQPIYMFMTSLCRRFPFLYEGETSIMGGRFPALRYVPPRHVFATPDVEPRNECYCPEGPATCPPSGTADSSPCSHGAPILMSFPHFYLGDPSLQEQVDGLQPDADKHSSFISLHPSLGFTLEGSTKFQVNIKVPKHEDYDQLSVFQDGAILPIGWVEMSIDSERFSPEVRDLVERAFSGATIEKAFKYGSLATCLFSLFVVLWLLCRTRRPRRIEGVAKDDDVPKLNTRTSYI